LNTSVRRVRKMSGGERRRVRRKVEQRWRSERREEGSRRWQNLKKDFGHGIVFKKRKTRGRIESQDKQERSAKQRL